MRQLGRVAALAILLLGAACNDSGDGGPVTTETGIPEVDAVTALFLSGNLAAMEPLIAYQTIACQAEPQIGIAPPCGEGEPVGTQLQVVPFSTCEEEFRRQDEFDDWSGQLLLGEGLYGVYEAPQSIEAGAGPEGDYIVLLTQSVPVAPDTPDPDPETVTRIVGGLGVTLDNGMMVSFTYGCGQSLDEMKDLLNVGETLLEP
jgi:hypothetical protein